MLTVSKFPLALLLMLPLALQAQKPKNYTAVTTELSQKIVTAPSARVPQSLAVVPFTATASSVEQSKAFGEYLTETIIGSISGHPDKLKLFERTRMDAILKEHEFILTDLMKPAAALKIGELAPIDALLSGTYTKLKSYIEVSARIIDVSSGEITMSYVGRIKMNKNLLALFLPATTNMLSNSTNTTTAPVQITINNSVNGNMISKSKSAEEICKERVAEFRPRLNDLSSQEKINAVVTAAVATPFDNQCGKLHYDVMYSFTRFKLDPAEYKTFLLHTLDTIRYPAGDERAYEIVRYLTSDSRTDENEWKSSFAALMRVGNYSISSYINYLIAKSTNGEEEQKARIATYFKVASENKLGLPRPVPFEIAFVEMMEGLKSNQPLRQHVYETYSSRLVTDDKLKATLFSELSSMYKEETQPQRKTELIGWLATFVNANEYPKAHEQLYDFAWNFNMTYNEGQNEIIRKEFPEADLRTLAQRCHDKFSTYALMTPYPSQKDDRINFCVKYSIRIPGVIPTLEEADAILKGNNLQEQLRVMKLLVLMETPPRKIESTFIALLNKRSLEDRGTMNEIQTLAIEVLGHCRTADVKAIDYMISVLPHYGNDTEAAMEALIKIGKPAVKPLIARLDKTTDQDGGLQFQLITLLGKIGKDAVGAERSIQRVLSTARNNDVKYAAEAALQSIKGM
ncbi:MAG: FlgO family outer membrane protein [Cyclobacteriaceae bacterium]